MSMWREPIEDGWVIRLPDREVGMGSRLEGFYSSRYSDLFKTYEEAERRMAQAFYTKELADSKGYRIVKARRTVRDEWNPLIRTEEELYLWEENPKDWTGQEQSEAIGWALFPRQGTLRLVSGKMLKRRPRFLYATQQEAQAVFIHSWRRKEDEFVVVEARRVLRNGRAFIDPLVSLGDEGEYFSY